MDGETMSLLLQPSDPDKGDISSLLEALQRNEDWFEDLIIKNSAVLLRGFDVNKAEGFNDIVETCGWDDIRYVGPAPRTHIYKRVWTANLMKDLYLSSYTTIMKCMLEEFPQEVEGIEAKGLKYTFTALSNSDTSSMKGRGWEDDFGTSDPAEAERSAEQVHTGTPENSSTLIVPKSAHSAEQCMTPEMDVEWLPNGGVKTILGLRPLTRVFEGRKGRRMWFNTVVGMHGKELSSALMADGTEIPEEFVKRCGEIIEESIQFKWEAGDVLFLDNYALLHGRRPSLPPRKVLVATCK
uniref:TauD/TfdA-like domain-containing protein n=2 Tax=Manihot esculenta TaxID=3983 RepID=A0A2C9VR35_MANES